MYRKIRFHPWATILMARLTNKKNISSFPPPLRGGGNPWPRPREAGAGSSIECIIEVADYNKKNHFRLFWA